MPTLDFKGKPFVYSHHLSVPFRELKIDVGKSLPGDASPSLDDNLIIHGDNLHALKALLPKYAGKVDVIYIDPPYNTGNEGWAYNDNVNSPLMKEWLKKTASENPSVDKDDLERHDKWLCMMWPRLVLFKELLAEGGIFIAHINDNEVFSLGLILDEIFGAESKVGCVPWLSEPSGGKSKTALRAGHEYILIYATSQSGMALETVKVEGEVLKDKFGKYVEGRELSKWGNNSLRENRPHMWFPIHAPDGTEVYPYRNDGEEGCWRWGSKNPNMVSIIEDPENACWEMRKFDDGVTVNGASERWHPFEKIREQEKHRGWKAWLGDIAFNADGTRELKELFGTKVFDTPKPSKLSQWLLNLHGDDSGLILDSFAGSGTTAHAVQALNAEDGGNRKFILVETEDYADTITAERVRRVIKGVPSAKDETLQKGLGGSFTYCDLGDPIDMESFFENNSSMPAYDQLASYIAYTATGEALGKAPKKPAKDWFIGEVGGVRLHLIYKPNNDFMKSHQAALDMETVKNIAAGNKAGKPSYVFAAAKYMGQSELIRDYDMTFCQLPYAIHRIMGDGVDG